MNTILGLPPPNDWVPRNQTPLHKYIKALREAIRSGELPVAPIEAPEFEVLYDQHSEVFEDDRQNARTHSRMFERRTDSLREPSVLQEVLISRDLVETDVESDTPMVQIVTERKRHDSTQPYHRRRVQKKYTRTSTGRFRRSLDVQDIPTAKDAKPQIQCPRETHKEVTLASMASGTISPNNGQERDITSNPSFHSDCHNDLYADSLLSTNIAFPPSPPASDSLRLLPERAVSLPTKRKGILETQVCRKRRAIAVVIPVRPHGPSGNNTVDSIDPNRPNSCQAMHQQTRYRQKSLNRVDTSYPYLTSFESNIVEDATDDLHQKRMTSVFDKVQLENSMLSSREVTPMTHVELQKQLRRDLRTLLRLRPSYAVVEATILPMVQLVIQESPQNCVEHEQYWTVQELSRTMSCWCSLIRQAYKPETRTWTRDTDGHTAKISAINTVRGRRSRIRQVAVKCIDPFLVDHYQNTGEELRRLDTLSQDLADLFDLILYAKIPFGHDSFRDKLKAYNADLLSQFFVKE